MSPQELLPFGKHLELELQSDGRKSFSIETKTAIKLSLFAQHTAEEFDLELRPYAEGSDNQQSSIAPVKERIWVAEHEHDDEVGSIALEVDGDVDGERLTSWISKLLRERGQDIFRMKGFIAIADEPRRFVFQGVHMLFDGQPAEPWGKDPRRNQLVFIGRNLDGPDMRKEFAKCLI